MMDRSEKHQSIRSDRQLRPVLNSVIFLLAANLIAKGALGLGSYQALPVPNNVQGSLFLTVNSPNVPPHLQTQQYLPWYPIQTQMPSSSSHTPKPITQTQIVNIGEPVYEDSIEEFQNSKDLLYPKNLFNRFNSIDDSIPAASNENKVKVHPETVAKTDSNIEESIESVTINPDAELIPQNSTESTIDELVELAKQVNVTTSVPVTITTTTTTSTTTTPKPTTLKPVTSATMMEGQTIIMNATNATSPTNMTIPGNVTNEYGSPNGYDNITFVYGPPGGNVSNVTNSTNHGGSGYYYYPAGDYGPSNGNENISITYGPPVHQRPVYYKPFISSPEDPYLNNYNSYYNNFYSSNPAYYSDMYKYNDIFSKFYNKYYYNNYPSFYNNYLGK